MARYSAEYSIGKIDIEQFCRLCSSLPNKRSVEDRKRIMGFFIMMSIQLKDVHDIVIVFEMPADPSLG